MSSTVFRKRFYLAFAFSALSLVQTFSADWLIEVELKKIAYGKRYKTFRIYHSLGLRTIEGTKFRHFLLVPKLLQNNPRFTPVLGVGQNSEYLETSARKNHWSLPHSQLTRTTAPTGPGKMRQAQILTAKSRANFTCSQIIFSPFARASSNVKPETSLLWRVGGLSSPKLIKGSGSFLRVSSILLNLLASP